MREDTLDRVGVPGWRRRLANSARLWLSSGDSEWVGLGYLVAYYGSQEERSGYSAGGSNVMVLKESKAGARRRRWAEGSEAEMFKICERSRRRSEDSDTDSGATGSEGELEWMGTDLGSITTVEDPMAKTMELLKAVQGGLQELRGGKCKRRSGGRKGDRHGYKPMQEAAKRTKALKSLQTKDVTRRQDEVERIKARRNRQTKDVQGSDQRKEGAKRTRAWKGLKAAGQFRVVLPQHPASTTPWTPGTRSSPSR